MKYRLLHIILSLGILFCFGPPAISKTTRILIIESYHSEYPWDRSYIRGIKKVMQGNYTFLTFQMDTKRIPKAEYENRAKKAWDYYLEKKPALVFLGDDNALRYLGPRFAEKNTPVVFLGINNNPRSYGVASAPNITGVLERPLLKRSIIELSKIITLKKILVLFDSGTTSKVILEEIFKGKNSISLQGIEAHLIRIDSWESWKRTVKDCGNEGYDAMVIGLYHTIRDQSGLHIPAGNVLSWTSANTPVPPFAFWNFAVGPGKAIGGLTLLGQTQGEAAAIIALKILSGIRPDAIPVTQGEKGTLVFSKSELEKYNITLPEEIAAKTVFID